MTRRRSGLRGSDGLPLSPLGIVALAAIPLSLAFGAYIAWPLKSLIAPAVSTPAESHTTTSKLPAPASEFSDSIAAHLDQIAGRSLFCIPREPEKEVVKGPAPKVYAGPQLIAMINGAAWFSDGSRIALDSRSENGIRIVRLNPPWGARVEWQGGEFDIELFKRTDLASLRSTLSAAGPSFFSPAQVTAQAPPASIPGVPAAAQRDFSNSPPGPGADPPPTSSDPPEASPQPNSNANNGAPASAPPPEPPPEPHPEPEPSLNAASAPRSN